MCDGAKAPGRGRWFLALILTPQGSPASHPTFLSLRFPICGVGTWLEMLFLGAVGSSDIDGSSPSWKPGVDSWGSLPWLPGGLDSLFSWPS